MEITKALREITWSKDLHDPVVMQVPAEKADLVGVGPLWERVDLAYQVF